MSDLGISIVRMAKNLHDVGAMSDKDYNEICESGVDDSKVRITTGGTITSVKAVGLRKVLRARKKQTNSETKAVLAEQKSNG